MKINLNELLEKILSQKIHKISSIYSKNKSYNEDTPPANNFNNKTKEIYIAPINTVNK